MLLNVMMLRREKSMKFQGKIFERNPYKEKEENFFASFLTCFYLLGTLKCHFDTGGVKLRSLKSHRSRTVASCSSCPDTDLSIPFIGPSSILETSYRLLWAP